MRNKIKTREVPLKILKTVLMLLIILIVLFPLIWLVVGAFKVEKEI